MTNTANAFRQAIEKAGLVPPDTIIEDGKLHRFSSNGDRADDSGWYALFSDETPAGVFGCWRTGLNQTWFRKADATLTVAFKYETAGEIDNGLASTRPNVSANRTSSDGARRRQSGHNDSGTWRSLQPLSIPTS